MKLALNTITRMTQEENVFRRAVWSFLYTWEPMGGVRNVSNILINHIKMIRIVSKMIAMKEVKLFKMELVNFVLII